MIEIRIYIYVYVYVGRLHWICIAIWTFRFTFDKRVSRQRAYNYRFYWSSFLFHWILSWVLFFIISEMRSIVLANFPIHGIHFSRPEWMCVQCAVCTLHKNFIIRCQCVKFSSNKKKYTSEKCMQKIMLGLGSVEMHSSQITRSLRLCLLLYPDDYQCKGQRATITKLCSGSIGRWHQQR